MDRLNRLLQLRAQIDRKANELNQTAAHLDAEIDRERDALADNEARRRRDEIRRHNRRVTAIPAAIGAGIAAARALALRHTRTITAFSAGATIATAATLGILYLTSPPPRGRPVLADPTPPLLPTGHWPPRQGPSKGRPLALPTTGPTQPTPGRPAPTTAPAPTPSTTPSSPSTSPSSMPTASTEPDGDEPTCRLYAPRLLDRGLMCGRLTG
ncbi:MAG: hypothetical protein ACRDP6_24655 [Actinoallomurus sp.]